MAEKEHSVTARMLSGILDDLVRQDPATPVMIRAGSGEERPVTQIELVAGRIVLRG